MDEFTMPLVDAKQADDAYRQSPRLGKSNFFRASSIGSNDELAPKQDKETRREEMAN